MKNPKVSIIVTTKNEEKNLGRLLDSVKNQKYKNIETVVVDNNSTDKTKEIAKKYTKKVFNKGPERSVQRNFGVEKSSGKYVVILDADMELSPKVIGCCVKSIKKHKALIILERTVGESFMAKIRIFEREMYEGDPTIEVARFFEKKVFNEFGGYDINLTGAEDYDLPKRISTKHTIDWCKEYLLHHEEQLTLRKQLQKKFYYASKSALYAKKHPDLVKTQGVMIFRKAYLRNWKKFVKNPILGGAFLFVKSLETIAAVSGYIKTVGCVEFVKTFFGMFKT